MTVIVSNPERGCGTKKEGGCYAESGDGSPFGVLLNNWCLGSHIEGAENFYIEVPPRGVHVFNPAASLTYGELINDRNATALISLREKVGTIGLLDHVGATNYTPRTFAAEVFEHGISRRIPPPVAREIARFCPIPIFFVAKLPIFPDDIQAIAAWASLPHEGEETPNFNTTPSWRDPRWSLRRKRDDLDPYRGHDHYMAELIQASKVEDGSLDELPTQQMVFFAGWITRVTYILHADETNLPDELKDSGVVPGILETDPRVAYTTPI